MTSAFRKLLYPLDHPRLAQARGPDARAFGAAIEKIPFIAEQIAIWRRNYATPFQGITCNGRCDPGLHSLADEGAPTQSMVQAAERVLQILDGEQRRRLLHPVDAPEWRVWSNPEWLIHDEGLRLDDLAPQLRQAVMKILEASLSGAGFAKARDCMRTNAFLGELCNVPLIMNEWSYNFLLFGEPAADKPWGWLIFGHHLCLSCFVLGKQMVISPTFMGAEPNEIDQGPFAGTKVFTTEETEGLALMRSLSSDLRDRARIYEKMKNDPAMPEGRWHFMDGLHLGGAFQDNRVVPYEGVRAADLTPAQRDRLLTILAAFIVYLPPEPLAAKMCQIERHLERTYWSWAGGYGDEDPFYFRIQSPVIMAEFDHHQGVWLNNQEPAKCHIHTVVRTPNGNDYGHDLLRQHYAQVHPGRAPGRD